nr:hypothetical protein CFP56_31008 [Quercus suber]
MVRLPRFTLIKSYIDRALLGSAASKTNDFSNASTNSPEASVLKAITLFCENENISNDDGVLHLPIIVETAECSPVAATAATHQIRKYLGKEYAAKLYVHYNAVMLVRILSDNPGQAFTKNFDVAFVKAVKHLLRGSKNQNTQQLLRETLDAMEYSKSSDPGVQGLLQMWRKEKGQAASFSQSQTRSGGHSSSIARDGRGMADPHGVNSTPGAAYGMASGTLPAPNELSSRIEEARNTAKILLQSIQSTPTEEVLSNDFIKEFGERCQAAQRSMQQYMNCQNPEPDHDTMQTLIETNEQLSLAGSRYQRALLSARRAMGMSPSPSNPQQPVQPANAFGTSPPPQQQSAFGSPALQPPTHTTAFGNHQPYHNHDHQALPGHLTDHNQTYDQAPQLPPVLQQPGLSYQEPQQPISDPFADPVDRSRGPTPSVAGNTSYDTAHQRQQSQAFSINGEPSYIGSQVRAEPIDSDSNYLATPATVSHPSPQLSPRSERNSHHGVSPHNSPQLVSQQLQLTQSPPRPGPGPWHNSDITQSYIGRQASAMNGLTMHGAQADPEVPEIDGHSEVGRKDRNPPVTTAFGIDR